MIETSSPFQSIYFGSIVESPLRKLLRNNYAESKIVIIVDENTHDYCLEYMLTSFEELTDAEVILLPAGEQNKVMEVCFQVWQALSDYEIGRKDLIINLGGGVVTDMGGFIAAVFKRGLDFIHVPTTLVGMVDAAIGGKTGIDLGPYKNQIGVFKQPVLVLIDTIFLSTLNDSERLNGYAEMLKHALIFDRELWDLLTVSHLNKVCNRKFIERSAKIKMSIVEKDPFEKDLRKVLNYGHTIGHALEGYFLELNEFLPHGQAVGIGMIAETYLSHKKGLLSEMAMKNILSHLSAVFHVPEFSKNAIPQILKLCRNDKKNESTKINFTLLCEIGNAKVNQHVSEADVAEALLFLGSLSDLKFTFSQD